MPASEPPSERLGRRMLTVVFWSGVGLAPLAALLLLVGQGAGALRVAAVLAVLAVVLIGLSITLRRDAETVRLDMEETLLEEVDMLREDVRNDIATAARATHKAFGEKLQALQETVQALRVQIELQAHAPALQGAAQRQESPAAIPQPPVAGHVGGRARVPGGVVRHTETVQVTTRQTIVDPHGDDAGSGTVYGGNTYGSGYEGGGYDGQWSAPPPPAPPPPPRGRRSAEPGGESWSDQRLRAGGGDGRRPRPYDRGEVELAEPDDGRWTGMRAGDRWTSVRSDERGREVRMGERRAAMHSDESGSEMRIEDRWAAVRREEPRRDDFRSEVSWRPSAEYAGGGASWQQEERRERRGPTAGALPAGGIEPTTSWGQQWSVPEPEPAGRRRRYRDEDESYR